MCLLFLPHTAAFTECNSLNDAPVIVYVSKMFPVPKEALPDNKARLESGKSAMFGGSDSCIGLHHTLLLPNPPTPIGTCPVQSSSSTVVLHLTRIPPTPPHLRHSHTVCTRPLTHEEIHQRHDLAKLRAMAKTAHAQAVAVDETHSMTGVK